MTTQKNPGAADGHVSTQPCAICEEGLARRVLVHQEFEYGSEGAAKRIRALLPVWSCDECGLEYLDEEGEKAKHAAVCHELGRLSPEEIKAIRKSADLNQTDFAQKLKVGIASVKRWELGGVIQNEAADEIIRRFAAEMKAATPRVPQFTAKFAPATYQAANRFQLREPSQLALAA